MTDEKNYNYINLYASKIAALGKEINNAISPLLKQQEQLSKLMTSVLVEKRAPLRNLQVGLHDFSAAINEHTKHLQYIARNPVIEAAMEISELFGNTISSAIESFMQGINESFEKLPARLREALITFSSYGWYYDPEMSIPDILAFKEKFMDGRVEEAEMGLSMYFEHRLDEIKVYLNKKFSDRKTIISDAFIAHKAGQYNLSIPVFFAQTDGICKELFDHYLFCRDKKNITSKFTEQLNADTLINVFLSPLKQSMPVNQNEQERGENFTGLNRHLVMHGDALDYGTKVNSLKTVSLVNYIARVTEDIELPDRQ